MAKTLLILAAESTAHESGGGPNPWLVGIVTLVVLLVLLLVTVAFGGGREHS